MASSARVAASSPALLLSSLRLCAFLSSSSAVEGFHPGRSSRTLADSDGRGRRRTRACDRERGGGARASASSEDGDTDLGRRDGVCSCNLRRYSSLPRPACPSTPRPPCALLACSSRLSTLGLSSLTRAGVVTVRITSTSSFRLAGGVSCGSPDALPRLCPSFLFFRAFSAFRTSRGGGARLTASRLGRRGSFAVSAFAGISF